MLDGFRLKCLQDIEKQDFLGWFELWLDYQDETDYFKDYVYE